MRISIITSCFNRADTIAGAMQSVLQQDFPDVEYIVVDGASTDGSIEKIKEVERTASCNEFRKNHPHFTFRWISEPDHGMYEAINKGIRMATGDVIGLVHSDDWLFDNHTLSLVMNEMERTEADFLYANGIYVNANEPSKVVRNWIGGTYHRWKVKLGWLPLHTTCYIKRAAMLRCGLYNEQYKIAADTDLLVRYLYKEHLNVAYLRQYVVRMRMGGLSTDSKRRRQMWNEDISVYSSHGFWALPTKLMKMAWKVPQFIFK